MSKKSTPAYKSFIKPPSSGKRRSGEVLMTRSEELLMTGSYESSIESKTENERAVQARSSLSLLKSRIRNKSVKPASRGITQSAKMGRRKRSNSFAEERMKNDQTFLNDDEISEIKERFSGQKNISAANLRALFLEGKKLSEKRKLPFDEIDLATVVLTPVKKPKGFLRDIFSEMKIPPRRNMEILDAMPMKQEQPELIPQHVETDLAPTFQNNKDHFSFVPVEYGEDNKSTQMMVAKYPVDDNITTSGPKFDEIKQRLERLSAQIISPSNKGLSVSRSESKETDTELLNKPFVRATGASDLIDLAALVTEEELLSSVSERLSNKETVEQEITTEPEKSQPSMFWKLKDILVFMCSLFLQGSGVLLLLIVFAGSANIQPQEFLS